MRVEKRKKKKQHEAPWTQGKAHSVLSAWETSGQSMSEFARQNGLPKGRLWHWNKKLRWSEVEVGCQHSNRQQLVRDALAHLEKLGYSIETTKAYRAAWNKFLRFTRRLLGPVQKLIQQFLEKHGVILGSSSALDKGQKQLRVAMRILNEFSTTGTFQRRRKTGKPIRLPHHMLQVLNGYEQFCREYQRISERNIQTKKSNIGSLLQFLSARGLSSISKLDSKAISDFISSRNGLRTAKSVALLISNLRSFTRYLCLQRLVQGDIVQQLPKIRIPRDANIRSIWDPSDVASLLNAVDLTQRCGKRDYAILLLGIRLGMRPSDITSLRLEHLLWEESRIEMTQVKTGRPLSVPLPADVGNAIIDYMQHGRPRTDYREVFLRALAPYEPITNIDGVIRKYQVKADVRPSSSERGFRSLRHTLATRLLEAETPLEVISGLLGHASGDTTLLYTKVEIAGLRGVALDPDDVR